MDERYNTIKSPDLCERCRYGSGCSWGEERCDSCVRYGEDLGIADLVDPDRNQPAAG